MVELRFIGIRLRIRLRYALGDYLGVTLLVTSVSAVRTLHAGAIFEEISTKSTAHDIVELLLDKFMAILLVYVFFPLANSSFTAKSEVEGLLIFIVFDEGQRQVYASHGLQGEPSLDFDRSTWGVWAWRSSPRSTGSHTTRSCSTRSRMSLTWRRLELQVGLQTSSHLICGYPAAVLQFRFDLLTAHFLGNIRYPQPEDANGKRMVTASLIDGYLNFVCFVDVELKGLVCKLASLDALLWFIFARGWLRCKRLGEIFAINGYIRSWRAAVARCSVVDVGDGADANRYMAAERLPLAGDVETIICERSERALQYGAGRRLPSPPSAPSMMGMLSCS